MKAEKKQSVHDDRIKLFLDIIALLPRRNVEQQYLAAQAGVHTSTIYNWLCGSVVRPRIDTIAKVAVALGYELELKRIKKPVIRRVK